MYSLNPCRHPGCSKAAVSNFDEKGEISEGPGFCYEHTADKIKFFDSVMGYVANHDKVIGLSAGGLEIHDIDLGDKKFYGCNLQGCTFRNVHGNSVRARMCMFDFSTFSDCDFLKSNIQYSSFAGSKFIHVLLTGSDIIHNNFNGIMAYQCSYDDSDLYNSRFIKARLINTSMKNCNLKKSVFFESYRDGVSFRLSNTREALFDRNKKDSEPETDEEN